MPFESFQRMPFESFPFEMTNRGKILVKNWVKALAICRRHFANHCTMEEKLLPGSSEGLERKNSTGNRRKQQVNENVVKKMSMRPDEGTAPQAGDFTLHITEAGEEVRTTSRIIKGIGDV